MTCLLKMNVVVVLLHPFITAPSNGPSLLEDNIPFAWGAWGQQKVCLRSLGTKENLLWELGDLFNQKSEKFSVNQSYWPNF